MTEEERNIDDPARLADEARENAEKAASELRAQRVPIETEPPTVFKPALSVSLAEREIEQ